MKSRASDLNKISKIISISNDYLHHKHNLNNVKGLVENQNLKRNHDVDDFLKRQSQYRLLHRRQATQQLQKDNQKIVNRISYMDEKRSTSSRVSVRSTASNQKKLSERTLANKTKRNFMKEKQIQTETKKMMHRVNRSHFKDSLSPKTYIDREKSRKQYKEISRRYSNRNSSHLNSVIKSIKCNSKQLPFLPFIASKHK